MLTTEYTEVTESEAIGSPLLRALCGYLLLVCAHVSAAQQIVVPVEGAAFSGELLSVGADGRVVFRVVEPKGTVAEATVPSKSDDRAQTRTLQLDELARWGHPVSPKAQTIVVLGDGGRIVTAPDWSGGAAVRIDGEAVVVRGEVFGEVRVPRERVRGIVFAQRSHVEEREKLMERVRREPSPGRSQQGRGNENDFVLLTNGDRLEGKLTGFSGGSLTIETNAGAAKLPLSRVEVVGLADGRENSAVNQTKPSPSHSLQWTGKIVVGTRDGSLIYAEAVRAGEDELVVEAGDGLQLIGGSVDDVVALQSLGGHFVYLSDMEPAEYRHVPYLSIEWRYERDRNVAGGPLVVGGKRYLKGIGMHSAGRLTYRLNGQYRRFDTSVAIDDSARGGGSATFGVYVMRNGKLHEAFKSSVLRGGELPTPVSVDVSGAQGLVLTVDYADRGDELDHADWLDARLVK